MNKIKLVYISAVDFAEEVKDPNTIYFVYPDNTSGDLNFEIYVGNKRFSRSTQST